MSWQLLNSIVKQVLLFLLFNTLLVKKKKMKRCKNEKICRTNYSVKINFKYTLVTQCERTRCGWCYSKQALTTGVAAEEPTKRTRADTHTHTHKYIPKKIKYCKWPLWQNLLKASISISATFISQNYASDRYPSPIHGSGNSCNFSPEYLESKAWVQLSDDSFKNIVH